MHIDSPVLVSPRTVVPRRDLCFPNPGVFRKFCRTVNLRTLT